MVLALPAFICILRIGLLLQEKSHEAEGIGLNSIRGELSVGVLDKGCRGAKVVRMQHVWAQTEIC